MEIPRLPEVMLPAILVELNEFPKVMKKISSNFFVQADLDYEEVEIIAESIDQSLDSARLCSVCCMNDHNAIFMKCGHAGICFECACEVWKKTQKCMICRSDIEALLKYQGFEDGMAQIVRAVSYHFD
jgi:superfamily II helicase